MSQGPIVCSLSEGDAKQRLVEWRQFLSESVIDIHRSELVARLRLRDGDRVILTAVDLARRERACCAFLGFALELHPQETWLEVVAPNGAASTLRLLHR